MKGPPSFSFNVEKFIEGTFSLTDAEVGFYVRLLCAQWSSGGLRDDDEELLRHSHGSVNSKKMLTRLKSKFKKCEDGLLRNERLEIQRVRAVEYQKSQAEKGRASGEARRNRGSTGVEPACSPPSFNPLEKDNVTQNKAKGTLEQVEQFCVSISLPKSDGTWFFHKCEGNGWKNGRNPIKDWRHTIRSWKAAGYMASQKNGETSIYPITDRRNPKHRLYGCA